MPDEDYHKADAAAWRERCARAEERADEVNEQISQVCLERDNALKAYESVERELKIARDSRDAFMLADEKMRQQRDAAREEATAYGRRLEAIGRLADRWEHAGRPLATHELRQVLATGEMSSEPTWPEPGDTPPRADRGDALRKMQARINDLAEQIGQIKARHAFPQVHIAEEPQRRPAFTVEQTTAINNVLRAADEWLNEPGVLGSSVNEHALADAVEAWREAGGRPMVIR
jgi:hypothetical protein